MKFKVNFKSPRFNHSQYLQFSYFTRFMKYSQAKVKNRLQLLIKAYAKKMFAVFKIVGDFVIIFIANLLYNC